MESPNIRYIPRVDHLRAGAAILIVLYHGTQLIWHQLTFQTAFTQEFWVTHRIIAKTPFQALVLEGHTAVALFMILSGFIFTIGSLGRDINVKHFLTNRLLRTYPLFLLLLFVGLFAFPEKFSVGPFMQTILGLANTAGALQLGSFSAMFWTIAVEWQFYLIFPLLLTILNRNGHQALIGIVLVFLIMRGIATLEGGNPRDLSYWTIIGRLDQFLIGMMAAVYFSKSHQRNSWKISLLSFGSATSLILGALFWLNHHGGWVGADWWKIFWPTAEGVFWALFLVTYLQLPLTGPRFLDHLFRAVGRISYSVYLLHFFIIQIAIRCQLFFPFFPENHLLNAFINTVAIIIPATLLLAHLTYTFIEKPFLEMRILYRQDSPSKHFPA